MNMLSLENFYYRYVHPIPPNDRYFAIQEIRDVMVVNFDCLYNRDIGIRGIDQLLFLLHKQGHEKRFLFISEDGSLITVSGAIEVIKNIIQVFNLDEESCCLICREYISINKCKVVTCDSVPYWCRVLYPYIKNIPLFSGPFEKKFALWVHRGTIFRQEIAKHLLQYSEQSYISYQESGVIVDQNLTEYFLSEIKWANQHTPIIYDQLFTNRIFNFDMIVGAARKPYDNYAIEIVVETDIVTTNWLTEKTIKNLYIGKPFLLLAGHGALRKLRNFGFKTFSPLIDERYDEIENINDRIQHIKNEIDRLSRLDLNKIYLELAPVLEHNRKHYENFISGR